MILSHPLKKLLIRLLLPITGFYVSVVEACPNGIEYDEILNTCSNCHAGGTFSYSASWSSIPTVMERNTTDTVTFSLSGSGAAAGGFAAQTSLGTFTATFDVVTLTTDEVIMDGPTNRKISHSIPKGSPTWSFTFNSGNTSGTASFQARGNPVNGNRTSNDSCLDFTGTSGDGPFPTAVTSIIVNDAPVINAGSGSAAFTEGGSAVTVAPSLSLTDFENSSTEIASASITITTNYSAASGDVLNIDTSVCTSNALVCSGSGTRTISVTGGNESALEFRNVLRAVTFSNSSRAPTTSARTVEFSVTDQHSRTRLSTRSVTVTAVEDPAEFDTPVYNRIGVGTSSATSQLVPEDSTVQLQFFATDPEGVSTSFTLESTTPALTAPEPLISVSASGLLTWTPDGTRSSVIAVVGVNDNVGTTPDETFSITLNVDPENDAPEITQGDGPIEITIDEDSDPRAFSLTLNAFDIDGDEINWGISSGATDGLAAAVGTGTSKAISYIPDTDFFGTDSFVVQIDDTVASDSIQINIIVEAVNDPPQLGSISDQVATENELFIFNAALVFSDVDDINNGTDITWDFQSGQPAGMTISNVGVINWTPPQTGNFDQVYGPIVVRAADGGENSAAAATTSFSVTVSPPDGDLDGVADYNDLCLTEPDSTNADNDNDGTPGSDGGVNDGGDVCDLDDDNDGMPDIYEDTNGLDAFDASDAAADADGDGVSNLDEFNAGTNPLLANLTIDATGYLTPFALVPPDPVQIHPDATRVTADNNGPFRPGRNSITWTASNSGNNNLGTAVQTLDVRPIVSFSPGQIVGEGAGVRVQARLNGPAAVYPVIANYTVSGTADSSDHNAVSGTLVFNSPDTTASLSFGITADLLAEGNETVIFTLGDVSNAVVGTADSHIATIVEGNVMHLVKLRFTQAGLPVSSAFESEGPVTVEATVTDVNTGQLYSIGWAGTDNSLVPPADFSTNSWSFTPVEGNYLVEVNVADSAEAQLSNRISRVINIKSGPPDLTTENSDGQGDDDITEGVADSDDDGIPDYLDSVDGNSGGENILPNQTVSLEGQSFLETEAGLQFRLGTTAAAAGQFSVIVTDADVKKFGSEAGTAPLNADDGFEHVGGIYDFEISGVVAGTSARVVIPLEVAIPRRASYRKFHPATGWSEFFVDANNAIASAPGGQGACPQPGSDEYRPGLNYLHSCLQLTIEDGGLNDADGLANGVIKDPGSIGLRLQVPEEPVVKGGGRVHPLLIVLFGLGIPLIVAFRKKKKNIDSFS